ncbi:MAG: PQQ-binding-like beta-propeller repeat protein [bacterium]
MRKSLALLTVVLAVLFVATGCKNKPPLTPVRPAGPDSVIINTEATYTTWTTDPNRDEIRYVMDWADDAFDTSGYRKSGDTVAFTHTWSMVGTYAVRATAQDENGNWATDWSDPRNVVVYAGGDNNPPNKPATPQGPATIGTGELATFSSSATDPDGDSVQLRFYWGDDKVSIWSDWVPGGTTVSDTVRYEFRGVKQVYAVARDIRGDTSVLSDPASITVTGENSPPGKPTISGPARGIKDGPMYLFFGRAQDPEGDNVEYKFYWGDGRESNWTASGPHEVAVPESTRYTATGTYNITCVARDIDGAVSETSEPFAFEVVGEGSILWAVGTDECVSSPAWARGRNSANMVRPAVVIGNTDGWLMAVDAWQGEMLYDVSITTEGFTSSPAVSGDFSTVYIGSGTGQLFALNSEGREKWARPFPDSATDQDFGATPVVDGASIYCAGERRYVYKLRDAGNSAELAWTFEAREEIYASPVLAGGKLIACDDSGYVHFLNPDNGQPLFAPFACDGGITASPAVAASGNIYVGTVQGTMYALNPNGGKVWEYTITPFAQIYSSPVIANDGGVVFGADNGYLYKLNPGDGQPAAGWPVLLTTSDLPSTAAVCADGVIYVVSEDEKLHAVRENGTLYWPAPVDLYLPGANRSGRRPRSLATEELTPSVLIDQHGIIYVSPGTNGLFAIAGRSTGTLATTAWPMFQHDVRHSGKAGSW